MAASVARTIDLKPGCHPGGPWRADSPTTARVTQPLRGCPGDRTSPRQDLLDYGALGLDPGDQCPHRPGGIPLPALADFDLKDAFGSLDGLCLAYVGDGNNVAHRCCSAEPLLGVECADRLSSWLSSLDSAVLEAGQGP